MGFSLSLSDVGKDIFKFSSGDWAKQANGSVVTSLGDTVVLSTVCISKEPTSVSGFLPLTVEYQEKTYAMGKIPGGFIKREGRPKDSEILCARLVDRPLRPLFPKGLTNEIQIIVMVLSSDGVNDSDVIAVNAASCALLVSDIITGHTKDLICHLFPIALRSTITIGAFSTSTCFIFAF